MIRARRCRSQDIFLVTRSKLPTIWVGRNWKTVICYWRQAGFDLFISTDQNLKYQQDLTGRRLAIVILLSTSWPKMQPHLLRIQQIVASVTAGTYVEIPI